MQQIAGTQLFLVCEGKLLLILRDNKPGIFNPNTWALPGGGVEVGEDFFQSVAREMIEELGIEFQIQILGVSPKGNGFFFAEIDKILANQIVLGEGQDYRFFHPDSLDHHMLGGAIRIYLEKYRTAVRTMIFTGKPAKGSDLGLFIWNGGKPSTMP